MNPPALAKLGRRLLLLIPFALAAILLCYQLPAITGLHRDEAAFGLFAEKILAGQRPLTGFFNTYTAPIHSYIIAGSFAGLGESVFSLRISGVLFNLLSLLMYFDIMRRLAPAAASAALWLLATFPVFVVFSRISGENYAMNPLFVVGGVWLFLVALEQKRWWLAGIGWFFSALFFYCACWNHIVSLPTVASLGVIYLGFGRPSWRRLGQIFPWFLAGGLVGALPKIYLFFARNIPPLPMEQAASGRMPLPNAMANFLSTLGGDALYARATGEIVLSLNWVLPLALGAALVPLLYSRRTPEFRILAAMAAAFILAVAGSWLITPRWLLGSRIWLLPLWFVPGILAVGLHLLSHPLRWIVPVVVVTANLQALYLNYFHAFARTGGSSLAEINVGGRTENSSDFMDIRPVVAKLRAISNESLIFVEDFNPYRLRFLMPEARHRIGSISGVAVPSEGEKHFPAGSLIVMYRSTCPKDLLDGQRVRIRGTETSYREDLSTANQLVFEACE